MAEESTSRSPFNLTTAIALVTIISAAWLAADKLRSSRPVENAEAPGTTLSEQAVRARLWDDPLQWRAGEEQMRGANAFDTLRKQITGHTSGSNGPLILAVLVDGGPYSENREARTRTRFAVVSALGRAGYAPSDSEHIGAALFGWPSMDDLSTWCAHLDAACCLGSFSDRSSETNETNSAAASAKQMRVSFEWYRKRVFQPENTTPSPSDVLTLWLEDACFEDRPNLRLGLFFGELLDFAEEPIESAAEVALIGPRSSDQLRWMLPAYNSATNVAAPILSEKARTYLKSVLGRIRLYAASPSAMDEVLVRNSSETSPPRSEVARLLTNGIGYKSFTSFCATDDQLARHAVDELKLRGVSLLATNEHLALISEWDTFYGRMLSLTYAAEVARLMSPSNFSRGQFVSNYMERGEWPANLHSFVYLRGLDGQRVEKGDEEDRQKSKKPPMSLDDLADIQRKANAAFGPAQFDYLTRLGERLERLENDLERTGRGCLKAVGIVGSDVYDTLLILQALRPRLPNAVFFTTELDARYSHPDEEQWTRNLVVLSGYGLQLNPTIQGSIAPFRNANQSAYFAATLAAVNPGLLPQFSSAEPRRFELARGAAVDLTPRGKDPLHPEPPAFRRPLLNPALVSGAIGIIVFGAWLATLLLKPLRRLTWEAAQYEAESLWYAEEDIGGQFGAAHLLHNLRNSGDPLAIWFRGALERHLAESPQNDRTSEEAARFVAADECGNDEKAKHEFRETDLALVQSILDFLNHALQEPAVAPREIVSQSQFVTGDVKERYEQWNIGKQSDGSFLWRNSIRKLQLNRDILHGLLKEMLKCPGSVSGQERHCASTTSVSEAAACARTAAVKEYKLRRNRRYLLWTTPCFVAAGAALFWSVAVRQGILNPTGEPFYLMSGASAWPTEILRLLALILCALFGSRAYSSVRSNVYRITRQYRLNLGETVIPASWRLPFTPVPHATVQANDLWARYQQLGSFWHRMMRTAVPFLLYCGLGVAIMQCGEMPLRPVRGEACRILDGILLSLTVIFTVLLTFATIDASHLCRWFVEHITEAPTKYPCACRDHFRAVRGLPHANLVEEWIDLRLITDVTDQVGKLIYYPFIVVFILLLSRNRLWDNWTWPWTLIAIFALNLIFAISSAVILQQSARRAKEVAIQSLERKLNQLEYQQRESDESQSLSQGRQLLQEMREIHGGAFVPLWENPILGAILVPSGGTVLIELFTRLVGR